MTNLEINAAYIGSTEVTHMYLGDELVWGGGPGPDYSKMPLTFKILSAGTIVWVVTNTVLTRTVEYKLNNGSWTSITSNTGSSAPSISVNAGDVVQFRGDNAIYGGLTDHNSFSNTTTIFEVEGNIMSLIDSTGYATATTLAGSFVFNYLFSNCTGLTSAENFVIPATALTLNCYSAMFKGCTSLTTAPKLLATALDSYCYEDMFGGCTSLTTAPKLLATTLAERCYHNMFLGCTSLTTSPALPATTLARGCYYYMFAGCTSLTTAPELPATTLTDECYNSMFSGCTSLTTAPELPATILVQRCYYNMFRGCSSLNYIKCLATDIPSTNCTYSWVSGVASSGTFVKHPNMSSWTRGINGIPNGWTVQDAQ